MIFKEIDNIRDVGGHLPLFASELEMSNSLVRQYLEIIVDLAEIKKEEKR